MDDQFEEHLMMEFRILALKIQEARAALADLEPRFQQAAQMIKTYGLEERLKAIPPGDAVERPNLPAVMRKGELIAEVTTELLTTRANGWIKTSEIYEHLLALGVPIGGKNPHGTLAAHLSNAKKFEADRVKGWRLPPKVYKGLKNEEGALFEKVEAPASDVTSASKPGGESDPSQSGNPSP